MTLIEYIQNNFIGGLNDKHMARPPWRPEERTASFKYYADTDKWYDFPTGKGGNLVELIKYHLSVSTDEAFGVIKGNSSYVAPIINPQINPQPIKGINKKKNRQEILELSKDLSIASKNYLASRGLAGTESLFFDIEYSYTYTTKKGKFVDNAKGNALGWKNVVGGRNARSKSFKGVLDGKTSFSMIGKVKEPKLIYIQEGYFDFASLVKRTGRLDKNNVYYVLNSTSFISRVIKDIKEKFNHDCTIVNLMDNDIAGDWASILLNEEITDKKIVDGRVKFSEYSDYNEYHMGIKPTKKPPYRVSLVGWVYTITESVTNEMRSFPTRKEAKKYEKELIEQGKNR